MRAREERKVSCHGLCLHARRVHHHDAPHADKTQKTGCGRVSDDGEMISNLADGALASVECTRRV